MHENYWSPLFAAPSGLMEVEAEGGDRGGRIGPPKCNYGE